LNVAKRKALPSPGGKAGRDESVAVRSWDHARARYNRRRKSRNLKRGDCAGARDDAAEGVLQVAHAGGFIEEQIHRGAELGLGLHEAAPAGHHDDGCGR
jgi:hypothetical protein